MAESEFFAAALCGAIAEAHGRSCACVKARGTIKLDAESERGSRMSSGTTYSLTIDLASATMTLAKASSAAVADTFTAGGGTVYATSDDAFCASDEGQKKDPDCNPNLATALATVSASSFGGAEALSDAVASSGSSTYSKGYMQVSGHNVQSIGAMFTSVAEAWAFSQAATLAMAASFSEVCADAAAIAQQCDAAYNNHCASSGCGFTDKNEACDKAVAFGKGYGSNYAEAIAGTIASTYAKVKIGVSYGGTIQNCKNDGKPLLLARPEGKPSTESSIQTQGNNRGKWPTAVTFLTNDVHCLLQCSA